MKIRKLFSIFFFTFIVFSCSSGSGGSPTDPSDPGDGNGEGNEVTFSNATNFDAPNQLEIISWNIQTFPQSSKTNDYLEVLLTKWNADVYFFQEIQNKNQLIALANELSEYSLVLSSTTQNMHFGLLYKSTNSDCATCGVITFNGKNELWSNTPNSNDGDMDFANNANYQFASRPPMENFLTWSNGSKTFDFYLIGTHYKCCGNDQYENEKDNPGAEIFRRYAASSLLKDYYANNRQQANVFIAGDFNNVGNQSITNPAIAPLADPSINDGYFKLIDEAVFQQQPTKYSWQGWRNRYDPAHLDHIFISESMFSYENAAGGVVDMLTETGLTGNEIDDVLSDHQPIFIRLIP